MAAICSIIIIGCHFTQEILPSDVGGGCSGSLTTTEVNTWFESGAASLNGSVKPANSISFPGVPNCDFYKWSAQMFLWLTSPAPPRYGSNGLVFNSPAFYDVTPDDHGVRHFVAHTAGFIRPFSIRKSKFGAFDLPVILEKNSLRPLEVLPTVTSASGHPLVLNAQGQTVQVTAIQFDANRKPLLLDSNNKVIEGPRAFIQPDMSKKLRLTDSLNKASFVQKIMVDKTTILLDLAGNFPEAEQAEADGAVLMAQNGSLVYYAITVNNVYALFRTELGSTVPDNAVFPTSQTDINNISAFAQMHGKSPIIDSEALAIEIKSAWVEAANLPDANNFIKMKAVVPTYDKTDPNDWVPNGTKTVELALVGMHVVGSTASHPEMLWATFEHVSNDPAADYDYTNNASGTGHSSQSTAGNWVFCAGNASAPFNQAHMHMDGNGHIVADMGFTISPSNIVRSMPWGLQGTNASGNAQVITINNIVRSVLDANDVRRNYIQTGTTWTPFGSKPTGSNSVGTNLLANTTMETFTQGELGSCFGCHADVNPGSLTTTSTSHIFDKLTPLF